MINKFIFIVKEGSEKNSLIILSYLFSSLAFLIENLMLNNEGSIEFKNAYTFCKTGWFRANNVDQLI